MFLGHINPMLCMLLKALVVNRCKMTEPRKKQVKVKYYKNKFIIHTKLFHFENIVVVIFCILQWLFFQNLPSPLAYLSQKY